jgi:uncharacterized lipoprotein YajG
MSSELTEPGKKYRAALKEFLATNRELSSDGRRLGAKQIADINERRLVVDQLAADLNDAALVEQIRQDVVAELNGSC